MKIKDLGKYILAGSAFVLSSCQSNLEKNIERHRPERALVVYYQENLIPGKKITAQEYIQNLALQISEDEIPTVIVPLNNNFFLASLVEHPPQAAPSKHTDIFYVDREKTLSLEIEKGLEEVIKAYSKRGISAHIIHGYWDGQKLTLSGEDRPR